jgi:hypothetical protein
MIVVNLDTEEATIIPVDRRRFKVTQRDESESQMVILIEPVDSTDLPEHPLDRAV